MSDMLLHLIIFVCFWVTILICLEKWKKFNNLWLLSIIFIYSIIGQFFGSILEIKGYDNMSFETKVICLIITLYASTILNEIKNKKC